MMNRIHHIGIFTNNPRELIKFYKEKIGFKEKASKIVHEALMKEIFDFPSSCSITKLASGPITIEILYPEKIRLKARGNCVPGYNHWSIGVKDRKTFCQELIKKGVHILEFQNMGRLVCFIKDPDGNLIEIYEEGEN